MKFAISTRMFRYTAVVEGISTNLRACARSHCRKPCHLTPSLARWLHCGCVASDHLGSWGLKLSKSHGGRLVSMSLLGSLVL